MIKRTIFAVSLALAAVAVGAPSASPTTASRVAGSSVAASPQTGGATTQPPNVVLMIVDDATVADIRYMPNVQGLLVDRGTTFARNYSPYPLCCPARATILSGQYPHNHGVLDNVQPLGGQPAFRDGNSIATYLDPAYRTSLVGKYMNGSTDDSYIPPGWDDWRASTLATTYNYVKQTQNVNGVMTHFSGYLPTIHGQEARRFIDSTPIDQPFFSYEAWVAPHTGIPHESYDMSASPYVSKRWRGSYTGPKLPGSPAFNEADVSDKPQFVRDLPLLSTDAIARIKQRLQQRRDSLMAVDAQVGKIVADVTARGQLDSTYFIFVSDNGQMQGEHRIPRSKEVAYEESSRVPLVIRGPGFAAGSHYDRVTGLQDLTPTILDLTNTTLPTGAPEPDGLSLARLVAGSVTTDRPELIEIADNSGLTDQQVAAGARPSKAAAQSLTTGPVTWKARGIVTSDRWKYIEYGTGELEMYDINTDPHELVNLAGRRAYASEQPRLEALYQQYKDCAGAGCRGTVAATPSP